MSEQPSPNPLRPDTLVGRKLPAFSLWQQLQRRVQPLGLEFCSSFFNGEMTYKQAQKWLADYGIKVSVTALQGFYNSMDMRLRFAALEAAQQAETATACMPAGSDLEAATKARVAQTMFELAHLNLGESQKLQLIALQQNKEGMAGNFALKKAKLDLDRIKVQRQVIKNFLDWYQNEEAKTLLTSNLPTAEKTERLGAKLFGELWQ